MFAWGPLVDNWYKLAYIKAIHDVFHFIKFPHNCQVLTCIFYVIVISKIY